MADPVSSATSNTTSNQCIEDDLDQTGSVCASATPAAPPVVLPVSSLGADDAATCESASAVWSLVQQFPPATVSKPPTQPSASSVVGYESVEPTSDGQSVKAELALLKSNGPGGAFKGSNGEALGVVAQIGKDLDLELIGLRSVFAISHGSYGLSLTVDGPSARANSGEHNDDGSVGASAGVGANWLAFEATLSTPIGSLTYGDGMSYSAAASVGVRDQDHDGNPEYCAKVSLPAYTIGACLEQFW